MNLALPDVSPEELAALRAQVQSLRSEADRQAREIRALESAVKVERLARERAEAKLKDLLRRLYGTVCFIKHTGPNVLPFYMLRTEKNPEIVRLKCRYVSD